MPFSYGPRSRAVLATLDPRLRAVMVRALALSSVDITLTDGLRSHDEHMRNYGKGRTAAQLAAVGYPPAYAQPKLRKVTWTLMSKHEDRDRDGDGEAVDAYPFFDGRVQMGDDRDALAGHAEIATAVARASRELQTPIRFGHTFGDRPHYELGKGL